MENPTNKEKFIKKIIRLSQGALAAATILAGSAHAEEKNIDIKQSGEKIEAEKVNQEQNWLNMFGNKSIRVGEAKNKIRSPIRQISIYNNDVYLGDIRNDFTNGYMGPFNEDDFIRKVANILDEKNIEYKLPEKENNMIELEIEQAATKKMEELKAFGLRCIKVQGLDGDKLVLQANEGKDFFNIEIDLKNDNNPDTNVKIDVDNKGALVISGKDDKPFQYEIVVDEESNKTKFVIVP